MHTAPLPADANAEAALQAGAAPPDAATSQGSGGLAIALGAVLGLAGERLVTSVGSLGFSLWVALLGLATLVLLRRAAPALLLPVGGWTATALAAALVMHWRDGPAALLPMLLVLLLAGALALLRAGGTRLRECRSLDLLLCGCLLPLRALAGIIPLVAAAPRSVSGRLRSLAGWGRGILLALPLLILFGALFAAADQRFATGLQVLARRAPELPEHLALALALGWICAGLLASLLPDAPWRPRLVEPTWRRLGREESLALLGLLCLLFLLFVGLQLAYLFGGPGYIADIPDLTVASYARRGFFELLAVALLSLALLLVLQPLAEPRAFRLLGRLLAACVLVLLASALQRLWLYVDSFGLTVPRVAALAVLIWLAAALALFLATVLRGRPRGFAGGAVLAALLLAFSLALANPDSLVARVNLERMGGSVSARGLPANRPEGDLGYLLGLGADAVPPLLEALPGLPASARCQIASELWKAWGPYSRRSIDMQGWRAWHHARTQAVAAVEARLPGLRAEEEAPCLGDGAPRTRSQSLQEG